MSPYRRICRPKADGDEGVRELAYLARCYLTYSGSPSHLRITYDAMRTHPQRAGPSHHSRRAVMPHRRSIP
jgi:hypothetical protein